jgi:tRNA (adenine-N(1)-)-methyltransferase non-catalytic subunit
MMNDGGVAKKVLSDLHSRLKNDPNYLNPTLTSSTLRRYQVLPGRTHPEMQGTLGSGYLLHAVRVHDEPGLQPVGSSKKRKSRGPSATENGGSGGGSGSGSGRPAKKGRT